MTARTDFDVIVVGAGPAGAHAATRLARAGRRVLVLDRSQFPRHKPCAGGLTLKTLELVDPSVGAVIERTTPRFLMSVRRGEGRWSRVFDAGSTICAFSVRERFDAHNFETMLAAGAVFEQSGKIDAIEASDAGITVRFDGRAVSARFLIGADGANSRVRRLLYPGQSAQRGFAIEGLVPYAAIRREAGPEFAFGEVPNGYGWLFPKADHANVGLYTRDDDPSLSKEKLRRYCVERLGTDAVEHITGFPLGFGGARRLPMHENVVLVGDAAGHAEPLLGEGIYNAVKSGLLAAEALISADATGRSFGAEYRRLARVIEADLRRCADMAKLFYGRLETLGPLLLGFAPGRTALLRGFAAGKTMREITDRALLAPWWQPASPAALRLAA